MSFADGGGRGNEVAYGADGDEALADEEEPRSLSRVALDGIKSMPQSYLRTLVKCPLCLFIVMQVIVGILIRIMWKGGDLNTDFTDFLRANTGASVRYDAMQQAWSALAPASGRRLQQRSISYRHSLVALAYYKEDGGNLLEERHLFALLNYEKKLQATERWQLMCSLAVAGQEIEVDSSTNRTVTQQMSCHPGDSIQNYIWPSYEGLDGISVEPGDIQQLHLDAEGSRLFPVQAVVAALRDGPDNMNKLERLFPKDFIPQDGGVMPRTDVLRSFFLFSQSYGPDGYYTSRGAADEDRAMFQSTDLHNFLRQPDQDLQDLGIRVFYSSGLLDEADIFSALFSDVMLSIGGLILVFLLICMHTQSLLLSGIGAFLVLECIPLGYVLFKQISGLPNISIVNCVSTFVIIGVGSDLVFVLTDAWRQSGSPETVPEEEFEAPPDEPELDQWEKAVLAHERHMYNRLVWVYSNAGISCVTTGLCGASSFLVNLLSVLMPLREFGLFMGLCCTFALVLELVMFPMALLMRETRRFKRRLNQQEQQQEDFQGVGVIVPVGAEKVVPADAAQVADPTLTARTHLQKRSFLVRFFAGFWSDFLERYKLWVVLFFVLTTLVSLVGIVTSIKVDGSPPVIFPDSHNQILGASVFERFENAVSVAASPSKQQAYLCDAGAGQRIPQKDTQNGCATYGNIGYCTDPVYQGTMRAVCSTSCGFTSFCLATWCPVEDAPNASKQEPGRCDCYQENAQQIYAQPAEAVPGILRFETHVVGFAKESWLGLEPSMRELYMDLAGSPGTGLEQRSTYGPDLWSINPVALDTAQTLPPYVQQHWRSGSVATWRAFQAPVFSVLTRPSNGSQASTNETVVKQTCFCDGIAPCSTWSTEKHTVYHPLSAPGGRPWQSSVDVLQDPAPRRLAQAGKPESCEHCANEAPSEGHLLRRLSQEMTQSLAAPRRLQGWTWVSIVWGLKVKQLGPFDLFVETDTEQMWLQDETFDPSDPWAQRSIMRATENMPEDLKVIPATTWLQAFEDWQVRRGQEFPARNFHTSTRDFLAGDGKSYAKYVLRDDSERVVMLEVPFRVDVTMASGLDTTTATRASWESWVANRNSIASLKANKALQVSSLWVNVEAQDGILRSTATTITTAIFIGYVAAVLFTQDFLLALFPMISVLLTVLCLLFTMVGILQWSFGAVDVIALIVFLGYMFTFNLHMAQYYNHAKLPMELLKKVEEKLPPAVTKERLVRERFCRVKHALTSIGQSLLCSAGTTTASAIFLLCCTLQFFVKFGAVILAVTFLSILHSLVFLPSFLLFFGPTSKSCTNFGRLLAARRESAVANTEDDVLLKAGPSAGKGEASSPQRVVSPPSELPPLPPPADPAEIIGSGEVDAEFTPSHPSPKAVRMEGLAGYDSQDEEV